MARLPTVSPIRNVLQADVSGPSPQVVASPWQSLADAFGTIGTNIEKAETADAAIAGQNAVHRGPDGELQVDLRPNTSDPARAYNRTAMAGFIARKQNDVQGGLQQIALASNGDPTVFDKESSSYGKEALRNVPDQLKGPVLQSIEDERQRFYAGVSEQKRQRDVAVAKNDVLARKQVLEDDLGSLALNGGTNTPDYLKKREEYNGLLNELASNRDFSYSPQQAEIDRQRVESNNMAYAFAGQAQRLMDTGDTAGAINLASRVMDDTNLHLSPQERFRFSGQIKEQIRAYQSAQREEAKPYLADARDMVKGFKTGVGFDDGQVDETANRLRSLGRPIDADSLLNARNLYRSQSAMKSASTRDIVRHTDQVMSGDIPGAMGSLLNVIASKESGGSYNVLNGGEHFSSYADHPRRIGAGGTATAAGRYQFVAGTWDRARVATGVPDFSPASQDKAASWLAQADYKQRTGRDLVSDLQSGDPTMLSRVKQVLGQTWEGLKYVSNDQFIRSMQGGGQATPAMTGGAENVPAWVMSPEYVNGLRQNVTERFEQSYSTYEQMFKSGTLPDQDTMHTLLEAIPQFTSEPLRQKYTTLLNSQEFRDNLYRQYPDPQQRAAIVSDIQASMQADGTSVAQYQALQMYREGEQARQEAIKNDPVDYSARRYSNVVGQMPPIQAADGNALTAGLQVRDRAVGTLVDHGDIPAPVSAFRNADLPSVRSIWRSGDSSQLSTLTSSMLTGMSPRTYDATLEDPQYREMITGAALSNDPVKHQAAMQQLDALASHVGIGEVEHVYSGDIVNRLQDWQAHVRYFSDQEAADWLKSRNDPKWQDRVKPLVDAGEKEARKDSVQSIATSISGNRFFSASVPIDADTQRMMQNDYVSLVGDRNGSLNDVGTAKSQAIERMKTRWGASAALGNRITFMPPENYYPALDGSHDWIGAQLDDFAKQQKIDRQNMTLIADEKTVGAVSTRQAPGYLVATVDPKTGFDNVVTDGTGRPLRIFFDPQEGQKQLNDAAIKARNSYLSGRQADDFLNDALRETGTGF